MSDWRWGDEHKSFSPERSANDRVFAEGIAAYAQGKTTSDNPYRGAGVGATLNGHVVGKFDALVWLAGLEEGAMIARLNGN